MPRTIRFPDGTEVPALGQGTWHMGERGADRQAEANALRLGLELGLRVIDTAEMYADGGAEEVVRMAVEGRRDEAFLVSKVYPQNASRGRMAKSCEASLRRMGVEAIDLYLLHWRGGVPLAETVEAFGRLVEAGKIRRWGVSNLDVDDLGELGAALPACAADQVLYSLEARGPEYDLLPFCGDRGMPVMAYSPVGQGGRLLRNAALRSLAGRHGVGPAAIALAFVLRREGVIAVPKASDPAHLRENAAAREIVLSEDDLRALDDAFPPPRRKVALAML
ncbi:aldo/keto reductase [Muricoccus vinaceus]|uniref:Aldo/keto reductase n=1 Tax=Muricoccus vinaceus TaxID=424704 RepID=A0ABV6IP86_9PROT